MSSSCGNPQTEQDALMTRRLKFDKSRDCVKCKLNPGNIVVRHAVYCKTCFFPIISTRFRKTIEPTINPTPDGPRRKALKAKGNLVVGFSGGLGSTVMLDLVWKEYFQKAVNGGTSKGKGESGGTAHPRNKRVWEQVFVCYVEVCSAIPGMKDRTEDVRNIVEQRYPGAEFIPLRVEDAFDPSWWARVSGQPPPAIQMDVTDEDLPLTTSTATTSTPQIHLRSYISSLPTQTALPSTLHDLTRLLLLHTAAARKASHLLLGTSLTSLSIALISGIAQGGGYVVREEAGEEWVGGTDADEAGDQVRVRVVRSLKDVGMKECAMWAWWCDLCVVGRDRYFGGRQGIGALTHDFIINLERDYPSTVSTIARTCAKLSPKEGEEGGICVLCQRPSQQNVQAWKSRISLRSYQGLPLVPPHLPTNSNFPASLPVSLTFTPLQNLTSHLCYACHTTLTSRSSRGVPLGGGRSEVKEAVPLPVWVGRGLGLGGKCEGDVGVLGSSMDAKGEVWRRMSAREKMGESGMSQYLLEDQ